MGKKALLMLSIICLCGLRMYADTVAISQIDNSHLLINQTVKAYVTVTDQLGHTVQNLDKENFKVYESSQDWPEKERKIVSCEQGVNIIQGINFMLIVDNSGSMYTDARGKETQNEEAWRITHAKNAVRSLLIEIKNPSDRLAFTSFNVKVGTIVTPTNNKVSIEKALTEIERPSKEEAYTELNESLYRSIGFLSNEKGRKAIILLSDGEDFPLKDNPNFPKRYALQGAIDSALQEGISVFTIGLGSAADSQHLERIARETGGAHFSAHRPQELKSLYSFIRERVLHEYLITYVAGMEPAEQTHLRIIYLNDKRTAQAEKPYYSAPLFGLPQESMNWLIFIAIPVALLLLWLLSLIKFEKKNTQPSLNVMAIAGKKKSTRPITIVDKKTIAIGGTSEADITITGDPKITMTEAKIENKGGVYTIVGTHSPIKVNNQTVETKVLRSGDLINVGNTTIVFDQGTRKTTVAKRSK